MRSLLITIAGLALLAEGAPRTGVEDQPPRKEARAMWVVRFALSSPQAVSRIVQLAKQAGFNALFVQVRGRGDAYYTGGLEPRAEYLDGQPESFDPLAQIVREAHEAGIQVHAWMNAFYCWSGENAPKSPRHVVNAHPDWLLADREGKVNYRTTDSIEGVYIDPGNAEARRFVHDVLLDVATRYEVDGIHFDYIRYPSPDLGFSEYDLAAFRRVVQPTLQAEERRALDASPDRLIYPHMFPKRWAQWRRDNVTNLVRSVYEDVKRVKPHLIVSASTIAWGAYEGFEQSSAYQRLSQDWFGWLKDGILDLAVPMAYHQDTERFAGWIDAAVRHSCGKQIWAGIGAYLVGPESTAEKIQAARNLGADGFSLFSYDAITQNGASSGYLNALSASVLGQPAFVPPFPFQEAPR